MTPIHFALAAFGYVRRRHAFSGRDHYRWAECAICALHASHLAARLARGAS